MNTEAKENKELIDFAKKKLKEAKQKLYLQEVILYSLKEYEKYRHEYIKSDEWTLEAISDVMAKNAMLTIKPLDCAEGNNDLDTESGLHKHIVSNSERSEVAVCCSTCKYVDGCRCNHPQGCETNGDYELWEQKTDC